MTATATLVEAHRQYLQERGEEGEPAPEYRHFDNDTQVWPPLPEGEVGCSPGYLTAVGGVAKALQVQTYYDSTGTPEAIARRQKGLEALSELRAFGPWIEPT